MPPRRSSRTTRQRSPERHACGWRLAGSSASVQLSPPALHSCGGWRSPEAKLCIRCVPSKVRSSASNSETAQLPIAAFGSRYSYERDDASIRAWNDLRTRVAPKTRMSAGSSALIRSTAAGERCHGTASFADGASPSTISSSSVSSLRDAAAPTACTPLSARDASVHFVRESGARLLSAIPPVSSSARRMMSDTVGRSGAPSAGCDCRPQ